MEDRPWQDRVRGIARGIRTRVLRHTIENDGGYLSQACSSAEILAVLYSRVLNVEMPETPIEPRPFSGVPSIFNKEYRTGSDFNGSIPDGKDRFILSPTHYSLVLYAALIETGRMASDGLNHFNRDGSSVEMIGAEHSPGMEVMTGSLGQGLSQGVGMALGRRLKGAPGRIVVMMSDGEFQIGMTWEAIQFMAHHKLDNVIVYVDVNGQQCDGPVSSVMVTEPVEKRIESFGGRAVVVDGHDVEALEAAGRQPLDGRPVFVLAMTDPCRDIGLLRRNYPKLHYVRFKSAEEMNEYRMFLESMVTGAGVGDAG